MRFGWIGVHKEGLPALEALLEARAPLVAAVTLKPELAEQALRTKIAGPLGMSLEEAAARYATGCPKCGASPCTCP